MSGAADTSASEGVPIVAIDAGYPIELVAVTGVPFSVTFDSSSSALFAKSLGSGE
jgi:hypothetical protein